MFDVGDYLFWIELREVDKTFTVYVMGGEVISLPRNRRSTVACTVRQFDTDALRVVKWDDHSPTTEQSTARQQAMGYALQVASVKPGSPVSVRELCPLHKGTHKVITVTCDATTRHNRPDTFGPDKFTVDRQKLDANHDEEPPPCSTPENKSSG